jgi:hypothetical protein
MCDYEHLLERKENDLDFLCGNDTMTSGGGYISHNIVLPSSRDRKECLTTTTIYLFFIFQFHELCEYKHLLEQKQN